MADPKDRDPPSPFVVEWSRRLVDRVPLPRRALDVAMGRGRHARVLAQAGYHVFGVDRDAGIVAEAVRGAAARGLVVHGWAADLERGPLPANRFELVVVTRYLQRDLFPSLERALTTGGIVLYETFTEAQRAKRRGPTSPDHLLKPGELRERFSGFDVLFYEEVQEPDAVARIVASKGAGRLTGGRTAGGP
jgi:SAM-dependent methyltransferase